MTYKLRYIEPLYGFGEGISHIAVGDSAKAQATLAQMGEELPGTNDLVAIYIPEGTDEAYQAGNQKGRIVGAVRLLPMPAGHSIRNYHHHDIDGSLRWPVGWPCEAIYAPPTDQCPYLRTLTDDLFGSNSFTPYVKRFQHGPFKLEPKMAAALIGIFSRFQPLR